MEGLEKGKGERKCLKGSGAKLQLKGMASHMSNDMKRPEQALYTCTWSPTYMKGWFSFLLPPWALIPCRVTTPLLHSVLKTAPTCEKMIQVLSASGRKIA